MISCDMGYVKVKGSNSLLKAELSTLIFSLKEDNIFTEDEIKDMIDKALNTNPADIEDVSCETVAKLLKIIKILEG